MPLGHYSLPLATIGTLILWMGWYGFNAGSNPFMAFVIGMIGGLVLFWATQLLEYFKIDDVVGAIPVHLFGGLWGTLSSLVWIALKETMGLRVTSDTESTGIDETDYVLSN